MLRSQRSKQLIPWVEQNLSVNLAILTEHTQCSERTISFNDKSEKIQRVMKETNAVPS